MNKRPFFAALLFGALSFAGILAMFSQARPLSDTVNASQSPGSRWISLDPGAARDRDFGRVLPAVIEKGVRHQLERMSSDKEKNDNAKPRRNILRLR